MPEPLCERAWAPRTRWKRSKICGSLLSGIVGRESRDYRVTFDNRQTGEKHSINRIFSRLRRG